MKSTALENELIEEVRNLEPSEYSAVISKLMQEFITSIYSPKTDLKNTLKLGNRIKTLLDKARTKQKQALYNNWGRIKDNSLAIQAQKLHRQHLFITKVNPAIIKLITAYNQLKKNISCFEVLIRDINSFSGAIEKDEHLFIDILDDYVRLEVFLNIITKDFIELANKYLDNILDTTMEAYKQFKKETYIMGAIGKICEDSINNVFS